MKLRGSESERTLGVEAGINDVEIKFYHSSEGASVHPFVLLWLLKYSNNFEALTLQVQVPCEEQASALLVQVVRSSSGDQRVSLSVVPE